MLSASRARLSGCASARSRSARGMSRWWISQVEGFTISGVMIPRITGIVRASARFWGAPMAGTSRRISSPANATCLASSSTWISMIRLTRGWTVSSLMMRRCVWSMGTSPPRTMK